MLRTLLLGPRLRSYPPVIPVLDSAQARHRFLTAPVARLGTVRPDGAPHLVPVVFAALTPDTLVTAIDHKPKRSSTRLARLENLAANPRVTLLADEYRDDWSQLWWSRADGEAEVVDPRADPDRHAAVIAPLLRRYAQYVDRAPAGPAILVTVRRWSGWAAV